MVTEGKELPLPRDKKGSICFKLCVHVKHEYDVTYDKTSLGQDFFTYGEVSKILILLEVQKILRSDCACSIFQSSMNPQYV